MGDIGEDIKDVLNELGSTISIYKYPTATSYKEYIDFTSDVNRGSPEKSHFIMTALLTYDTMAKPGDLVTITDDPIERFLIVSSTSERFEKDIISKEVIMYKCNAIAEVRRRVESRNGYDMELNWPLVYSGEYCFFTGTLSSQFIEENEQTIGIIDENEIYISDHIDLKIEDRCIIKQNMDDVSGEAYEVKQTENNRFPNIKICKLREETRE